MRVLEGRVEVGIKLSVISIPVNVDAEVPKDIAKR